MEQNYMNAQLFLDVYNRKEISPELLVRIVKEYQRSESLSQKSNFIYLISEIMRYAYTNTQDSVEKCWEYLENLLTQISVLNKVKHFTPDDKKIFKALVELYRYSPHLTNDQSILIANMDDYYRTAKQMETYLKNNDDVMIYFSYSLISNLLRLMMDYDLAGHIDEIQTLTSIIKKNENQIDRVLQLDTLVEQEDENAILEIKKENE